MPWADIPAAPDYQASRSGYVRRRDSRRRIKPIRQPDGYLKIWLIVAGRRRAFRLHRLIAETWCGPVPAGAAIDHRNGRRADCRAANLRVATTAENNANRRRARRSNSGYRGVSLTAGGTKARAYIRVAGRTRWLGDFIDPAEAARAYDAAAAKAFGAFAVLNFPVRAS